MREGPAFTLIGALVGDPARASMLTALMSGQALTASELALGAGIAPQTASGHLSRLLDGGLLSVERQGRHRYYRLAGNEIATAIEAIMTLAEQTSLPCVRPGPKDPELRYARVCYDHLAGECGVELYARLSRGRLIKLDDEGIAVTAKGEREFTQFGIDIALLRKNERPVCRTCLDWSERKTHLAGALGAGLLSRMLELKWAKRVPGARILRFTTTGEREFVRLFNGTR